MADNTFQQENKSIATEDIAGNQVQRVKIAVGEFGLDESDVSTVTPIPAILEADLIARGLIPGKTHINVWGSNPDVDTAAAENVWAAGGLFQFPDAPEIFNIVSTSPLDNGAAPNIGAQSVEIEGLDENFNEITETVTLNGTTNVPTVNTFVHIQRIQVLVAGTTEQNQGSISATGDTSSLIVANFPAGQNASSLGHYMVPAGKTAYIERFLLSAGKTSGAGAFVTAQFKQFGSGTVFRTLGQFGVGANGLVFEFTTKPRLLEKSQFKFLADVLSNNTAVTVFLEMLVIDN